MVSPMFQTAKIELLQRVHETGIYFRAVCPSDSADGVAVSKGLLFVQLYAIWEYSVRSAVQAGINELNKLAKPASALRPELLGIGLDEALSAMHDSDQTKNKWDRRIRFFQRLVDPLPVVASGEVMPNPGVGRFYRPGHLNVIWAVFGITQPTVPNGRLLGLIEELIENRHAIAHGRETAANVGRRYTILELHDKVAGTQVACLHILQVMESHCSHGPNLCR